jgi:hypothetical protein
MKERTCAVNSHRTLELAARPRPPLQHAMMWAGGGRHSLNTVDHHRATHGGQCMQRELALALGSVGHNVVPAQQTCGRQGGHDCRGHQPQTPAVTQPRPTRCCAGRMRAPCARGRGRVARGWPTADAALAGRGLPRGRPLPGRAAAQARHHSAPRAAACRARPAGRRLEHVGHARPRHPVDRLQAPQDVVAQLGGGGKGVRSGRCGGGREGGRAGPMGRRP